MVEFVCEAGLSHNGKLDLAKKLADKAKLIGAHIIKYQTYVPEKVIRRTDPDFKLLASLALPYPDFRELAKHCDGVGIEFLTTPGDLDSLKFAVEELGVRRIKIGSDDLTNEPLLHAAFKTGLPVILSTGMATLREIHRAIALIGTRRTTLLHCVSCYPCRVEDANLAAMSTLKQHFACKVGYSDHTRNELSLLTAASLGATMIEAHMMLPGISCVDYDVSFVPTELWKAIHNIATITQLLGHGRKEPCKAELTNMINLRKGEDGLRGAA